MEYTQHDESHVFLSTHNISIPLITGAEAVAQHHSHLCKLPPCITDDCAETGEEFAKHVKNHFKLLGPQLQQDCVAGKTQSCRLPHKVPPPTESGRPETGTEFAQRMKDHFKLLGPGVRKEGRETAEKTVHHTKATFEANTSESRSKIQDQAKCEPVDLHDSDLIPDTSLIDVVSGGREGIDLLKAIQHKYLDDPFFKNVAENPREFKNFKETNRLVYLKLQEHKLVCIPKVMINGHNIWEIVISEAHSLLAHLGTTKTLDYLQDHVWWKDMVNDT